MIVNGGINSFWLSLCNLIFIEMRRREFHMEYESHEPLHLVTIVIKILSLTPAYLCYRIAESSLRQLGDGISKPFTIS